MISCPQWQWGQNKWGSSSSPPQQHHCSRLKKRTWSQPGLWTSPHLAKRPQKIVECSLETLFSKKRERVMQWIKKDSLLVLRINFIYNRSTVLAARRLHQFSCFVQLRPEGEAAEASSPITRKPSPPTDSCGGVNFSLISVMLHFFKLRGGASYFLPSFLSGGCNKALP